MFNTAQEKYGVVSRQAQTEAALSEIGLNLNERTRAAEEVVEHGGADDRRRLEQAEAAFPALLVRSRESHSERRQRPPDREAGQMRRILVLDDSALIREVARVGLTTRQVPVILVTGRDEPSDRRRFEGLDVAGVIPKPFDAMTLSERVSELLGWER